MFLSVYSSLEIPNFFIIFLKTFFFQVLKIKKIMWLNWVVKLHLRYSEWLQYTVNVVIVTSIDSIVWMKHRLPRLLLKLK